MLVRHRLGDLLFIALMDVMESQSPSASELLLQSLRSLEDWSADSCDCAVSSSDSRRKKGLTCTISSVVARVGTELLRCTFNDSLMTASS